ncbi:MAG TPA: 23S rRNA (pseudouridine(1915)-N(3))-methyltransferase RlmH [Geobacterales bacterium]|nr:23S rRNA (pseudouridine(1915)-N(3))-methyltransferase RlmH [Geobacterales bacterium]
MKLRVLWVGKSRASWVREASDDYATRIRRHLPLEIIEVREEKGTETEAAREAECQRILRQLPLGARVILLDERGELMTSVAFATQIGRLRDQGVNELVFVIGGAHGFSERFRSSSQHLLALSPMTVTHEMARVILLEQLYRALSILQGSPYHH